MLHIESTWTDIKNLYTDGWALFCQSFTENITNPPTNYNIWASNNNEHILFTITLISGSDDYNEFVADYLDKCNLAFPRRAPLSAIGKSAGVSIFPVEGSHATIVTHDWTDKTTWYEGAQSRTDKILTPNGEFDLYSSGDGHWIDVTHGKITDENKLATSYPVTVKKAKRATLSFGTASTDEIDIESVVAGMPENSVTIEYTTNTWDGAASTTAAIATDAITVSLANNGTDTITATVQDVLAALADGGDVENRVSAILGSGVTGGATISAEHAQESLSGATDFAEVMSGITVDYDAGTVTFTSALTDLDVVTGTYNYADSSTFTLKPDEGKVLRIEHSEVQFSKDTVIGDAHLVFEVWAYNPADLPNKMKVSEKHYKNVKDFINEGNRGTGVIPTCDVLANDVLVFPFEYLTSNDLLCTQGAEVRLRTMNGEPFNGEFATATFYCFSADV